MALKLSNSDISNVFVGGDEVSKIYRGGSLVWEQSGGVSSLPDGLIAYWKLDEASGSAVSSVGTNTATANNAPVSTTGLVGNARAFEKDSNQWLGIASPSGLAPGTNDFTYSTCFKYTSDFYYNTLFEWGNQSAASPYMWLLLVNGSLQVQFVDGLSDFNSMATGASFTANIWNHLTCVFDRDGNLTTYKNGASAATNDISGHQGAISPSGGIGLNAYYNDPGLALDGAMDEVKLWNRVLTGAEVLEDYNNVIAGIPLL